MRLVNSVFFFLGCNLLQAQTQQFHAPETLQIFYGHIPDWDLKRFGDQVFQELTAWENAEKKNKATIANASVQIFIVRTPDTAYGNVGIHVRCDNTKTYKCGGTNPKGISLWDGNSIASAVMYIKHATNVAMGLPVKELPALTMPRASTANKN